MSNINSSQVVGMPHLSLICLRRLDFTEQKDLTLASNARRGQSFDLASQKQLALSANSVINSSTWVLRQVFYKPILEYIIKN